MSRGDHQVTAPEGLASLIRESLNYIGNVVEEIPGTPAVLYIFTQAHRYVGTVTVTTDEP